MPIVITSKHDASLTVPISGNPNDQIRVAAAPDGRSVTFTMSSDVSPADARQKIRDFLDAARTAAQT